MKLNQDAQRNWDGPMTIAQYWESHGYSKAEAKEIERQQIEDMLAEEEANRLYDQGIWNLFD